MPLLTLLKDYYEVKVGEEPPDFTEGATAVDDIDGNVPVTIEGEWDRNSPGVYKLYYVAKDSEGNIDRAVFIVHIVDEYTKLYRFMVTGPNEGRNTGMITAFNKEYLEALGVGEVLNDRK